MDKFVSDESGEIITYEKLKSGTYRVNEVNGPEGFKNGKNFINVEINSKSYKIMVDADGKTDRGKTAVVFDIEDVIKERYLKTVTEKNGRQVMDDNQLLKNQLLMALA